MQLQTLFRPASCVAAAAMAGIFGAANPAHAATFPALNTPESTEHIPGKLVWVDLFTADPETASKFYCGLLGWTASTIDQKAKSYTVFSNDGKPVAGLAPRSVVKENHPSRWIGYFAVADIGASIESVIKNGGTMHAPSRKFPDRGFQAIFSDVNGVPIGLLQSSSGDTPDTDTKPGEWNWFELYVRSPKDVSEFYHSALGFDVSPERNSDRKSDFVLSSAGKTRGGIAPLPEGTDVRPSWLGVIRVENLDATLAKVPGLGGEVLVAPHSVEFGSRFAIISDPTGGTLGLVQYIDSANPANSQ